MSLNEEIKDRFMTDSETILEAHLDNLEGMFQFHEDGTMELLGPCRKMGAEDQILLYLIARRYQYEASIGEIEDDSLEYAEIYPRFPDKDDSTIRGYVMNLRQDGFAKKQNGGYALVVERLPDAVERIKERVKRD